MDQCEQVKDDHRRGLELTTIYYEPVFKKKTPKDDPLEILEKKKKKKIKELDKFSTPSLDEESLGREVSEHLSSVGEEEPQLPGPLSSVTNPDEDSSTIITPSTPSDWTEYTPSGFDGGDGKIIHLSYRSHTPDYTSTTFSSDEDGSNQFYHKSDSDSTTITPITGEEETDSKYSSSRGTFSSVTTSDDRSQISVNDSYFDSDIPTPSDDSSDSRKSATDDPGTKKKFTRASRPDHKSAFSPHTSAMDTVIPKNMTVLRPVSWFRGAVVFYPKASHSLVKSLLQCMSHTVVGSYKRSEQVFPFSLQSTL